MCHEGARGPARLRSRDAWCSPWQRAVATVLVGAMSGGRVVRASHGEKPGQIVQTLQVLPGVPEGAAYAAKEPAPGATGWRALGRIEQGQVYACGRLRVISLISLMKLPRSEEVGLTWHVSVSHERRRPNDRELRRVRWAFGMREAEEDNHHPGRARHLMMPVNPAFRVDCECSEEESVIVEPDGYTWTNPIDGPCRGCEFEQLTNGRKRCPLHGGTP